MLVDCKQCQAIVEAKEHGVVETIDYEETGLHEKWTVTQCPRCKTPSLVLQVRQGVEEQWDAPTRLYPPEDYKADFRLPGHLKACFTEAISCLRAKAYSATALMCRKSLEALCRLQGSTAPNLARALKDMHEKKIIDDRLYEWAEALRSDGNLAAHEIEERVSREDAVHMVDFTEAILEYAYIMRPKFERYRAERAKRAKPKAKVARTAASGAESIDLSGGSPSQDE